MPVFSPGRTRYEEWAMKPSKSRAGDVSNRWGTICRQDAKIWIQVLNATQRWCRRGPPHRLSPALWVRYDGC